MNITDLIVKKIQEGLKIELPGIGTLCPQDDHSVILTDEHDESNSLLKEIAAKECVSEGVAQRMLKNYIDALTDKLDNQGEHELPGIGTITKVAGAFGFAAPGAQTHAAAQNENPLAHINIYHKDDSEDPFAIFNQPIFSHQDTPAPEPKPEPIPEPEPVPQEEPVVEEPIQQPEQVVEEPAQQEEPVVEKPAQQEEPVVEEPIQQPEPVVEEPAQQEEPVIEEPIQQPEPVVEEPAQQEKPAVEEPKMAAPIPEPKKADAMMSQLDELDRMPASKKAEPKKDSKKGRKGLWIFLVLLLLLLAGGACYYFFYNKPAQDVERSSMVDFTDEDEDVQEPASAAATDTKQEEALSSEAESEAEEDYQLPENENEFTNNSDLIGFSESDIHALGNEICSYLDGYIANYAARKGYSSAAQPLMAQVRQYADSRLSELLDTNIYSVRRFFPYEDYVYNYRLPDLKNRKGHRARMKVQDELLEGMALDQMLEKLVEELGLTRDGGKAQPKKAQTDAKPVPNAKVSTSSLRGFDVIAGFFTNRSNALSMTNRLKEQGCDAYIIDRDGYYYVSMGSAATRTAAESMMKYIKTWYAGDVAIKQF